MEWNREVMYLRRVFAELALLVLLPVVNSNITTDQNEKLLTLDGKFFVLLDNLITRDFTSWPMAVHDFCLKLCSHILLVTFHCLLPSIMTFDAGHNHTASAENSRPRGSFNRWKYDESNPTAAGLVPDVVVRPTQPPPTFYWRSSITSEARKR